MSGSVKRFIAAIVLAAGLLAVSAAPTISYFAPPYGSAGDRIKITGAGFTGGSVGVKFYNNKPSPYFYVISDTVMEVEVPSGVQTGPVTVTVGGSSFTSLMNFNVVGPGPYIIRFLPGYGVIGDEVSLEGIHLTNVYEVRFTGAATRSFSANANGYSLTVNVPNGATTGPITLAGTLGNATSSIPFTVVGPGPYVSGFNPISGNDRTEVYLIGLHLSTATNVTFNGKSVVSLYPGSDTQITVLAPDGVTSGPIKVSTPQGTFTTSSNFFGPPVITGFSPNLGRAGTNVVITGTNFLGATAVLFGELTSSFVVLSNNAVRATVPADSISAPVRINVPMSSFITATNLRIQPTITGFVPGHGVPTTVVAITGAALNEGATAVKFGGLNAASFTVVGYGQINATVPAGATNAPISVTTSNGTVASASIFYVSPVITGFSSSNSPAGSLITIFGQNLLGTTNVSFNGTPATFIPPTENNRLEVTVPLGFTTGPVTITTPGGSASSPGKYYGLPSLSGFAPTSGLPGTMVTITGKNLEGATQVLFNGLPSATLAVVSNNSLQAMVPANATTGYIMVFTPGGSATTANVFSLTYTADLILSVLTSPTNAVAGSNFVYTLNLFNDGPHTALNVKLTNAAPANAVLKSVTTTTGTTSSSGNIVIGLLGDIISGGSCSMTITIQTPSTGNITNIARVLSDTADPAAANNQVITRTFVEPLAILDIDRFAPNQVRLSWPATLSNMRLQARTNLSGPGLWLDVQSAPMVISNQNTVTEPAIAPSKFYRLRR